MRIPHDRVTVTVRTPASNVIAQIDVSRQNIAGRHSISILVWNALFFDFDLYRRDEQGVFYVGYQILNLRSQILVFSYMVLRLPVKIVNGAFVVLMVLSSFSGCRSTANVNSSAVGGPVRPMRIVTDDLGRTVTIPTNVTRVVSLAPNLTESIFAIGAGERLVGVTTFCNYPEQAKEIAKIGDTMNPNMESIIALKPDVVFVSTASQIENFMRTLEANGITVYVTNPTTLTEVLDGLESLGQLFGTEETIAKLLPDLRRRVDAVSIAVQDEKKPRVFVQISREPLFTIGADSVLTHLVYKAAGDSVTAGVPTQFPMLSKETASALSPEVIILSESEDNREPNDVFKNSPAFRNKRVYKINADLLSRPGPRLVDALEQIAKDLHPEKFK